MTYFALTEATASWLVGKAGLIDALHRSLFAKSGKIVDAGEEFIEGPFHIAVSVSGKVVGMWNADYLNGTGDEPWGFIRISGDLGIENYPAIGREVLERCLYVISQRLKGLTIDGAYFPRMVADDSHTCAAGRGSEARHVSIAFVEGGTGGASQRQQAIVCVGPEQNWKILEKHAVESSRLLPQLIEDASSLLASGRKVRVSGPDSNSDIRNFLRPFSKPDAKPAIGDVQVEVSSTEIDREARYSAASLSFSDWMSPDSPLTSVQRRILISDSVDQHPIRIVGPGGSGKTLLMQLLALRQKRLAEQRGERLRIIYIVHNQAMVQMAKQRFDVLLSDEILVPDNDVILEVKTLSQVARELLDLEDAHVIDTDAHAAKAFQYEEVRRALGVELSENVSAVNSSRLLASAKEHDEIADVLAIFVMSEISIAIKGQGLAKDKKKYVQSARSLSRLHGVISESEREFVFCVFERYHREVFENLEVLDSDDLAISLLGRIRTPIWDLRRRQQGYDYIFVDETQLFNENERRIIPLLTNSLKKHVPVVLALDEAQSIFGLSGAGFASLGIEGIASESLASIHRSTKSIVDLAFFVIQRSTDLFGVDFPDFTNIADQIEPDSHPLAGKPRLECVADERQGLGKFVLKRVRELRKSNIRQICVIVHADHYWEGVIRELQASDLPLHVMLTRGERISADQPVVVLTRPSYVGGQEFDAVVLVGLEQGVVPPKMGDSEALSAAVEQQVLREIYLSLTRARYRVVVALSHGASPSPVLADAARHGLLAQ